MTKFLSVRVNFFNFHRVGHSCDSFDAQIAKDYSNFTNFLTISRFLTKSFFYLQWRVVRVVEPRPWTQTARTTWWTSSEPRCVFVISLFATASMLLSITPTQSVESLVIRTSYFWPIITSDLLRLLTLTKKILCLSMTLTNRESPPCWALTILLIIVTGIMNHLFY